MSNKVTINGNEYSYGEIVESEFFDDKSKEIVLNGEVVKVGDVWLTRELKEVLITNISIGRWPIRDDKERTYTVNGITDFDCKVSGQDLMTKYVKDTEAVNDTENTEAVNDTEDVEAVKDTYNGIDNLPILDIQIGDVWETSTGERVEIESHLSGSHLVWVSTEGVSYTDKGTYFSSMISPNKDLVTRVIRTTEIKEATEINEATSADDIAPREALILDSNTVKEDFTYEFTNTVARLVRIVAQEMKYKAVYRDINEVKRLTKVLKKVIALESL